MPSTARSGQPRSVLIGCEIGAVAGIAWTLWGASGLAARSVPWAATVAVVGIVVGVLMLFFIVKAMRQLPPPADDKRSTSMFSSWRYRITVIVEALAIVAGVVLLGAFNRPEYIPPLIAIIVGIHFLGFLPWWRGFALLGGALIVAGIIGAIVGVLGATNGDIAATVGFISAVVLFCSATRVFSPSSSTAKQ